MVTLPWFFSYFTLHAFTLWYNLTVVKIGEKMVEKQRCKWVNLNNPKYIKYHDECWGVAIHEDISLFRELSLEILSAGLSYEIVFNKREAIELAFDGFNLNKIKDYKDDKINELLLNKDIIRSRSKLLAIINNSRVFLEIQAEFRSFNNYIWSFTGFKAIAEAGKSHSELSDKICKDLKARGIKGIGSITIYSYLSAIGIINAHEEGCYLRKIEV